MAQGPRISQTFVCVALLAASVISGCGTEDALPAAKQFLPRNSGISPKMVGTRQLCSGTNVVLATAAGSKVQWSVSKVVAADAAEVPVLGSIEVNGWLSLTGDRWTGSEGGFEFDATTIQSFDRLRDTRISEIIFGQSKNSLLAFGFHTIATEKDKLPRAGEAIETQVKGALSIAGFQVPIEIPVLVAKTDSGFRLTQTGGFTMNIRGEQPTINTLGLNDAVATLMSLVQGVDMKDNVAISFDIEMIDACS